MRDRASGGSALDGEGAVPAAIRPHERVALRVEAGKLLGAGEVREVIATLSVLGGVIDDAVRDLDLANRVVALEVRGIVLRVPQAEFDRAEEREAGARISLVGDACPPDLCGLGEGHEVERLGTNARVRGADDRVAEPVTAAVVA